MDTPIADFVRSYSEKKAARFHMPGHKGVRFTGAEPLDITEIEGADLLYSPSGIIAQSENNASELFGTAHSFYSAEGSTLAIKAMLTLACQRSDAKTKTVLAARNAHKAFIYAAALLDLSVEWIYPERDAHICACRLLPNEVEGAILSSSEKPCALYITSPDYLGNIADVEGIAKICRKHQIPLLVDNAHGAYLAFLENNIHPMALGADMCCDSAHKTLPVLTGGAYLHISKNAPKEFLAGARNALSLFASTSPSYLILQSLDLCNEYLAKGYKERLAECIEKISGVKKRLSAVGYKILDSEPLKIVIDASAMGISGHKLGNYLRKNLIEPEFCDEQVIVLMATPENGEDIDTLCSVLENLHVAKCESTLSAPRFERGQSVMSIREAILSPQENIPVKDSVGRICASPTVSCPPAIPIAVSGEMITEKTAALFELYGIDTVSVVKK